MPRNIHGIHGLICAIVLALLVLTPQRSAQAARPPQLAQGGRPLDQVARITLPRLDAERLREKARGQSAGQPARFGEVAALRITPANSGTSETLADGSRLWRIRISGPGALSLSMGFARYAMSPNGRLAVYTPDYATILGVYTAADNERHGQLWTPILPGNEGVIELHAPADEWEAIALELGSVARGFTGFGLPKGSAPESGSCNIDVVCPEGDLWRPEIRSVAVYTFVMNNGIYFCSGALINNTNQDHKPYFLTASHCVASAEMAASVVTYWNYQSLVCRKGQPSNDDDPGPLPASALSGAILRATYAPSDFTLLELDDAVPSEFAPHWAGWDRSASPPASAVTIHHPQGHEKRISKANDGITVTSWDSSISPGDGTHLRIGNWDSGTTEKGSSGAPLFNPNHHIVGQLHGGWAACGNTSADYYGRLAKSWGGGGSAASRLSDWLDPQGTGEQTLDGINLEPDFSVRVTPETLEVCAPDAALFTVTLRTSLGYTDTVNLAAKGNPAGTSLNFNKSSVATPGTATLTLNNTANAAPGTYQIEVVGSGPTTIHSDTVAINLAKASPASTSLLTPTVSAHSQLVQPTLFWQAVGNVSSYRLEIASNSTFSTLAYSATTSATSHFVSSSLAAGSHYFWRVITANGCGETVSQTGAFSTRTSPEECSPQISATEIYSATFESGAIGWTASVSPSWYLSGEATHSGTQAFHAENLPMVGDQRLESPRIKLPPANGLTMQFWHLRDIEPYEQNCYDGGILEIALDGGPWTVIPAGRLLRDPYNGGIVESYRNPLGGLAAWCGKIDWSKVVVDLDGYGGRMAQFRFRLGTDSSQGRPGWTIDDMSVRACGWVDHKVYLSTIQR